MKKDLVDQALSDKGERVSPSLFTLSLSFSWFRNRQGTATCTFRHSYTKTNAGTHTLSASGYESVRSAHSGLPPQLLTSLFWVLPWKLEQLQRGRLQVWVCFILFVHACVRANGGRAGVFCAEAIVTCASNILLDRGAGLCLLTSVTWPESWLKTRPPMCHNEPFSLVQNKQRIRILLLQYRRN